MDLSIARSFLRVDARFAAPRRLGALVVLFAAVDDVPPPLAAAPMEGCLLLSSGRHARGLRSLLVPSCRGGRLNGGLLCGARLEGSG